MKILHICSNYIGNRLYQKLFSKLAKENVLYQDVYIPLKNRKLVGKNEFESDTVNLHYDPILAPKHRLLYKTKINKQLKRIEQFDGLINETNIIHAHTLYSDGGTAYLLKKQYGLKYIVSVRNTDINIFYKYFLHLRNFAYSILLEAENIIFVSEAYKEKLLDIIPKEINNEIVRKSKVIPNGIDEDWLEYKNNSNEIDISLKTQLLFVGTLNKNKNLITVLKVLNKLNKDGILYNLNVVGNGPDEDSLKNYTLQKKLSDQVNFLGYLSKNELQDIMASSDIFVLPSIHETFGISYIEAMSKGLPVIYTKNEGIDGLFKPGQVGYSVEPFDVNDIVNKIELIKKDYNLMSKESLTQSKKFSWDNISKSYLSLYLSFS